MPFGAGVLGVALIFMLPEFSLRSMPEWEEHWERGTEASNADNINFAIEHVAKAALLAPKDEYLLSGIWDYLGRLYMDQKNYKKAEKAFIQALSVVTERKEFRPVDFLNCHNQLSWFYQRTNNKIKEEHHLKEVLKYNRLVYETDSVQEAGCWHRLAEIAYERGEIEDAFGLQTKAIEMESHAQRGTDFSLNYMKEQLLKWKTEQINSADAKNRAAD